MAFQGRLKELFVKYGKVGLGVHLSVSAMSIAGLYVAIKNNVDVESMIAKIGLHSHSKEETAKENEVANRLPGDEEILSGTRDGTEETRKRGSDVLVSGGGALMLALLCNKALFPVRVPITIALTPSVAKFLASRSLVKGGFR
ncbi:hypothetical protein SUGI_0827190 [Cryptomeria japonica]|uniref:uncharacterized protein LOC131035916 n=1 Tax=Cryptomeria japonica TaxID=3369 RepID=UPI002414C712|nr:uncharacterized protein LOC131035916 [Cryptomeria japonica]GLJ40266.1 hypothetical protein SUGI_0827190 [Cryptomeria japonica]